MKIPKPQNLQKIKMWIIELISNTKWRFEISIFVFFCFENVRNISNFLRVYLICEVRVQVLVHWLSQGVGRSCGSSVSNSHLPFVVQPDRWWGDLERHAVALVVQCYYTQRLVSNAREKTFLEVIIANLSGNYNC